MYSTYSIKNSSIEYTMRGETPPIVNFPTENHYLNSFFDESDDEEIFSQFEK